MFFFTEFRNVDRWFSQLQRCRFDESLITKEWGVGGGGMCGSGAALPFFHPLDCESLAALPVLEKKTRTHKKKRRTCGTNQARRADKGANGKTSFFSFFVLMVREIFFGSNCLRWSTVSLQGQGGGAKIRPIGTRPFFFVILVAVFVTEFFFSTEFLLFFLPRSRSTVIV